MSSAATGHALVLGGTRFVGPRIVHKLVDRGFRVTVFNRGTRGEPRLPEGVTALRGERASRADLARAAETMPDVVFDTCCYEPAQAEAAVEAFRGVRRYVYVSTVSAYAQPNVFPIEEDASLGAWPLWGDYGAKKAAADRRFLEIHGESGFPVVIARPSYVLGPHNHVEREAFFVSRMQKGLPVVVAGDGETLVHFTFADEEAESLVRLADAPGVEGQAFNVTTDHAVTVRTAVECFARAIGAEVRIVPVDPASYGVSLDSYDATKLTPFANAHVVASNERLKRATAMTFAPIFDKLAETARWFAEHSASYPVKLRPVERRVLEERGVELGGL
jgi:2'-hydroxyisoflavone reductase